MINFYFTSTLRRQVVSPTESDPVPECVEYVEYAVDEVRAVEASSSLV